VTFWEEDRGADAAILLPERTREKGAETETGMSRID
jgi:hypothetical protein